MGIILGPASLQKTDSSSPSGHQSSISNSTRSRFCWVPLLLSVLRFWLAWSRMGLIHTITDTVSSCVQWLCHVQKILFLTNICYFSLFQSLLSFSHNDLSEPCGVEYNINVPFRAEHSTVSYFLHTNRLWVYVNHYLIQKEVALITMYETLGIKMKTWEAA